MSQKLPINNGELIKQIGLHPCLYIDSRDDFKNQTEKTKMWNYVAAQINSDVSSCMKRWKNLKDRLGRVLKLIDMSKVTTINDLIAQLTTKGFKEAIAMSFFYQYSPAVRKLNANIICLNSSATVTNTVNLNSTVPNTVNLNSKIVNSAFLNLPGPSIVDEAETNSDNSFLHQDQPISSTSKSNTPPPNLTASAEESYAPYGSHDLPFDDLFVDDDMNLMKDTNDLSFSEQEVDKELNDFLLSKTPKNGNQFAASATPAAVEEIDSNKEILTAKSTLSKKSFLCTPKQYYNFALKPKKPKMEKTGNLNTENILLDCHDVLKTLITEKKKKIVSVEKTVEKENNIQHDEDYYFIEFIYSMLTKIPAAKKDDVHAKIILYLTSKK